MEYIRFALSFVVILLSFSTSASTQKSIEDQCIDLPEKKIMSSGWRVWKPYQFEQVSQTDGYRLTGMDIKILSNVARRVGVDIEYEKVAWNQQQTNLKNGIMDIASGATYSDSRAEYVYFSVPYRLEENSLFVSKKMEKELLFNNIDEFLAQVRLQNFRLGIIKGFVYADHKINEFINDSANSDIVFAYSDTEPLNALLREEIDGFLADRIVGASTIIDKNLLDSQIREVRLNISTPIHFMFSKKTVSLDVVDHFNHEIKQFVGSSEYRKIIKNYLYPVLLFNIIDSDWFYIIGVIGTIAFAISGLTLASQHNATLFGTFLLALMPSVGGGIMRDVMINRDQVSIILTPSYMYQVIIVVCIGFAIIKLLNSHRDSFFHDKLIKKISDHILIICDALGQSSFIVVGVSVVIMVKIDPIWLWGPFFAFLTSNGGSILRDLIGKNTTVSCVYEEDLNAEISVLWGIIFSLFLDNIAANPSAKSIEYLVIFTTIGAFITKLLAFYCKVPNLKFHEGKCEP